MTNLGACPFCGELLAAIHVVGLAIEANPDLAVRCSNCQASGPTEKDQHKALHRWNDRRGNARKTKKQPALTLNQMEWLRHSANGFGIEAWRQNKRLYQLVGIPPEEQNTETYFSSRFLMPVLATNQSFALELALKLHCAQHECQQLITHRFTELYDALPLAAQAELEAKFAVVLTRPKKEVVTMINLTNSESPAAEWPTRPATLRDTLIYLDPIFERWRYLFEYADSDEPLFLQLEWLADAHRAVVEAGTDFHESQGGESAQVYVTATKKI